MRLKILFLLMIFCVSVCSAKMTGIWYSTWYTIEKTYEWTNGFGIGSYNQLLGDVSGDGKDDGVVFFNTIPGYQGHWYVATSNGESFNSASLWKSGFGLNSNKQFLADVNGDGKDDAVVYYSSDGSWYVALSNGNGFDNYSLWISGYGVGSTVQLLSDVTGDGCADVIVFWNESAWLGQNGIWYVSTSNGVNAFNGLNSGFWRNNFGGLADQVFVANCDESSSSNKADAIAYYASNDSWWVCLSTGSSFGGYSQWAIGFGDNATKLMVGDTDADNRADAVAYYETNGDWFRVLSQGNSFSSFFPWKSSHGNGCTRDTAKSTWQGLGDVYGVNSCSPVTYYSNGVWKIIYPSTYYTPAEQNLWQAWNINYIPKVLGAYQYYDSGNPTVINEHITMCKDAGIDFFILDLTNNINTGFIKSRALTVRNQVRATSNFYYAVAAGGMQFDNDPNTLEFEAGVAWDDFANNDSSYFNLESKPLLVYYCNGSQRSNWENWSGDKTNSNRFTIRWAKGDVTSSNTPSSEYHLYYGWGFSGGSLSNSYAMTVMPGWDNHLGYYVARNNGDFYQQSCWDRVLTADPGLVIINSFNDYTEETLVAPSVNYTEPWPYDTFYWQMTSDNNLTYKAH